MEKNTNHDHRSVLGVGGRLASGPAPELVATAFAHELATQLPLFDGMSQADLAHTVALIEAGIVPATPGRELLAALLELHQRPPNFVPDPARGDLYTNREAWLAARTPATGWLGAGRARRESTTIGYRIALRDRLLGLAGALLAAGAALLDRADEYRAALMADYTYLQPAQPTTFGHYLLTFAYPLLRDLDRLQELFGRTNRSPAGCGSVNGSRLPQDRARLAELLGFDGLAQHARDAMWQPDSPIETLSVVVAALVNLDRMAEDLQIFATAEFNLIDLADGHSRASVIMPQKKNPYALNYIRGVANQLLGALASSAAIGRTPSGQVDNRTFAYGDVPHALDTASGAAALMAGVVRELRFNAPLAAERLAGGFAPATDLAEVITLETGLDFRSAHRVVGRLVRDTSTAGRSMRDLTSADLDAAAQAVLDHPLHLPAATFAGALDPASAVAARQGPGGAAAAPLAAMLDECRTALAAHATWREQTTAHLLAAEEMLLRQARRMTNDE
jgi:argininosuccinate lyase